MDPPSALMRRSPDSSTPTLRISPLRISMSCWVGPCGSTWRGSSPNWSRVAAGGYCFEHATLFAAVLERLGFEPVRHAARVTVFQPLSEAARTHMFLSVELDGR